MKTKILIVEDNDEFRIVVKEYLKKQNLGVEIFEASTGEMAVAKACCVRPEIVLMDMRLPNITGLVAAKQIKEDNPECRIIALTMFEVEGLRQACKNTHIDEFIGKSELYERLVPAIKQSLKNMVQL